MKDLIEKLRNVATSHQQIIGEIEDRLAKLEQGTSALYELSDQLETILHSVKRPGPRRTQVTTVAGQKLLAWRKKNGLTQSEAGQKTATLRGSGSWGGVERGSAKPGYSVITELCEMVPGLSGGDFFEKLPEDQED